ncbi:MAG: Methyltransferase type 11 [Actinomycetia bacterium]|nr:Methyltransferase type 11 [Actinomycetes bacterium]
MTSRPRSIEEPARFLDTPRAHLHRPTRGHPLAHIIRELRAALGGLVADLGLPAGATVVDYGCADLKYRDLFGEKVRYVGADLPGNRDATIELHPDGTLPIPDSSADAVFSSQVLEHVADPAMYLAECERVLRPGGKLLLSTHGIMVYHRDPVDYWRWTGEGLQRIVSQAGLGIIRFEGVMGLAATGLQLFQDGTYQRVPRSLRSVYFSVMQSLVGVFDRQSRASRAENALVYALIAVKPDIDHAEHEERES